MAHDLHAVQLVVGLSAAADDPGGLAQADLAADHQRVGGAGAAVAAIVELVGLERVVVVESVGPGDELGARPHLTAAGNQGRHPVSPEPQEGGITGAQPSPHSSGNMEGSCEHIKLGRSSQGSGPIPHSCGQWTGQRIRPLIPDPSLGDIGTFLSPVLAFNLLVSIIYI